MEVHASGVTRASRVVGAWRRFLRKYRSLKENLVRRSFVRSLLSVLPDNAKRRGRPLRYGRDRLGVSVGLSKITREQQFCVRTGVRPFVLFREVDARAELPNRANGSTNQ